jgi:hypothetical protein
MALSGGTMLMMNWKAEEANGCDLLKELYQYLKG